MCTHNLLKATFSTKFRQEVGRRGRRLERGFCQVVGRRGRWLERGFCQVVRRRGRRLECGFRWAGMKLTHANSRI